MPLKDRKVIVTGGPTVESLDPVRFISNRSTGKMGRALADETARRAGETVFVHGPMHESLLEDAGYRMVSVESTEDLLEAVRNELTPNAVLIMAAAPADYRPVERSARKIKKKSDEMTLRLVKNPDILKTVASIRQSNFSMKSVFLVGFAAETDDIEGYALGKLREKDLDMICVNDVGRRDAGFGVDTNIVTIFTKPGERIELPLLSKHDTAARILDIVEEGLSKKTEKYLT
jgi:phosphopantothenoylcysteine decarboxylase/phosphopantothenate--cysteine ligase